MVIYDLLGCLELISRYCAKDSSLDTLHEFQWVKSESSSSVQALLHQGPFTNINNNIHLHYIK